MKKQIKKFGAVLFDMDGVLTDSMPYHFIAWFEALRKYHVRVTPIDIFEMEGAKWDEVIKFVFAREKKYIDDKIITAVFKDRDGLFSKYFKRFIFEGIPETLKALKNKGVLTGLVTGSALYEAKKMLPKEIYDIFDARVAGDMVKRGKPYPDPYLAAAKLLKVKPPECFVVENAPYGIKAAKSANMTCAAITTSLPKKLLSRADIVFETHEELYRHFDRIFGLNSKND